MGGLDIRLCLVLELWQGLDFEEELSRRHEGTEGTELLYVGYEWCMTMRAI